MNQFFFIQITPGLEPICKEEILEKWPLLFNIKENKVPKLTITPGGVRVETTLSKIGELQYYLKTANRILWEIETFKCRDFPKLFNKIKKMPLSSFYWGQEIKIHSSSKKSRLIHSERIKTTIEDALRENIKAQAPKKKNSERATLFSHWNLFAKLNQDMMTLSLDLSGERLGIRGQKKYIGLAPVRENLAAALFLEASKFMPEDSLKIIDPFCGSGTFLFESAQFWDPTRSRTYAFEFIPQSANFEGLPNKPSRRLKDQNNSFYGRDISENQLAQARKNAHEIPYKIDFLLEDSLQSKKPIHSSLILMNPPWGERLGKDITLKNLTSKTLHLWTPEVLGILIPRKESKEVQKQNELYKKVKTLAFSHGGIDLDFLIFKRNKNCPIPLGLRNS